MLSPLKPTVEKGLKPVARLLQSVNPNVVTLFGLVFPIVFFVLVLHKAYALALLIFVCNAVDLLDGMIARQQQRVTAFGGFLDSTVDRFADFTVLTAFGFANLVHWGVVLPLALLSFLISYIRSRTELATKGTLSAGVGIVERTERLLAVFVGLTLYAIWPHGRVFGQNLLTATFAVLIVLSAVTVAQRVQFAYKNL